MIRLFYYIVVLKWKLLTCGHRLSIWVAAIRTNFTPSSLLEMEQARLATWKKVSRKGYNELHGFSPECHGHKRVLPFPHSTPYTTWYSTKINHVTGATGWDLVTVLLREGTLQQPKTYIIILLYYITNIICALLHYEGKLTFVLERKCQYKYNQLK